MLEKKIKIINSRGIHLKPATIIAQYCLKNQDLEAEIIKGALSARGDSVMSILSLEINKGSTITVKVKKDNPDALRYIIDTLNGKIG